MTYIVLLLALLGQADIMSLASVSVCLLIYNVIIAACLSSKGFLRMESSAGFYRRCRFTTLQIHALAGHWHCGAALMDQHCFTASAQLCHKLRVNDPINKVLWHRPIHTNVRDVSSRLQLAQIEAALQRAALFAV